MQANNLRKIVIISKLQLYNCNDKKQRQHLVQNQQ